MQRTTRKLFAVLAAGTLALTACGSDGTSDPTTSGENTAGGSSEGSSSGTVEVWHYFTDPNQVALMDKYAELAEAANEGMTVENVFVPYDQMNSNLVAAVGAGEGPDIAVFNGAEASVLASAGVLAPLDDYLGSWADASQLPDSVLHKYEDQTVAVQGYVNLLGLWYNADILDEIGVEPPTTMDELEAAMAKAKDAGYGGITMAGVPQGQGEWQAYPWLTAEGFSYDNLDAKALGDGLARVKSWVDEGYLSPEVVTWDQTVPFQQFAAGNIAFAENGNWQLGTAASDADFNYGVVALPIGETGQVYLGGEGQGIGAFSQNPDLAWKYLESSYLSIEGQEAAADLVGSIPTREDAADIEAVTSNELLVPFAQTVVEKGVTYPNGIIPADSVADVQLAVGQVWSSVLGGQVDPHDAAEQLVAQLESIIGQ